MPTAMNTSPRTRRPFNDLCTAPRSRLLAAAFAAAAALSAAPSAMARPVAPSPALQCTLSAPAEVPTGAPVLLQMTLRNTGTRTLQVLTWNTPFEGAWRGASVQVWRAGQELPYQGPSVKRAAPTSRDYIAIAPGGHRSAQLDLGQVFALKQAGTYDVKPEFRLHDVQGGDAVRPQAPGAGLALACAALRFKVTAQP